MRTLIPLTIFALVLLLGLSVLYGCAQPQTAAEPPRTTFALVGYSPEFSRALAQELQTAPPEIKIAISDYIKLRCAIKPEMQICIDLQK